jgi:serine/threonine protein kinase
MFILITGSYPFYDEDETKLQRDICAGDSEKNFPEWSAVDPSAQHLIKSLLQVDPAKRISA